MFHHLSVHLGHFTLCPQPNHEVELKEASLSAPIQELVYHLSLFKNTSIKINNFNIIIDDINRNKILVEAMKIKNM